MTTLMPPERAPVLAPDRSVVARFWAKVQKSDNCWEWTGLLNAWGYGRFWTGRHMSAHRYSWELHNGPIPAGLYVCHHCDNRKCVRPDHLFLGTQRDNLLDASRKGRLPNQQKTHCAKGHPFSGSNVRPRSDHPGRQCVTCQAIDRAPRGLRAMRAEREAFKRASRSTPNASAASTCTPERAVAR